MQWKKTAVKNSTKYTTVVSVAFSCTIVCRFQYSSPGPLFEGLVCWVLKVCNLKILFIIKWIMKRKRRKKLQLWYPAFSQKPNINTFSWDVVVKTTWQTSVFSSGFCSKNCCCISHHTANSNNPACQDANQAKPSVLAYSLV